MLSSKYYASIRGLNAQEVARSRREHGANTLPRRKKKGFFRQFLSNFGDPLIKILLAALCINAIMLIKTADCRACKIRFQCIFGGQNFLYQRNGAACRKGGSECAGNRPGNGDGRQNFSKIPACGAGVWRLLLSKGHQSSRRNGAAKWRADDGDRGRDCSKRKAKEKNVPAHFGCAGTAEGAHHCRLGAFL